MLGLTQQQLADLIGVTYQQAHKYERGINRISAGRLYEIAQVLSVPIGYFFDGLDGQDSRLGQPARAHVPGTGAEFRPDPERAPSGSVEPARARIGVGVIGGTRSIRAEKRAAETAAISGEPVPA